MGLEDVTDKVKENYSQSSPNSSRSRSSGHERPSREQLEEEHEKVIGSPPHQKVFSEEKWDDVKRVLRDVMGRNVNRVLNLPAEQRHEILHEAAMYSDGQIVESEYEKEDKCPVCNKAVADDAGVSILGYDIHVHHTAGQIESAIKDGNIKLG